MQKCWTCEKATGGCSWTAIDPKTGKVRFEPVPGWEAEPTSRSINGETIMESYAIHDCPQYTPDGINRLDVKDQIVVMHQNGATLRQIALHTGIRSENRLRKIIEEAYL